MDDGGRLEAGKDHTSAVVESSVLVVAANVATVAADHALYWRHLEFGKFVLRWWWREEGW